MGGSWMGRPMAAPVGEGGEGQMAGGNQKRGNLYIGWFPGSLCLRRVGQPLGGLARLGVFVVMVIIVVSSGSLETFSHVSPISRWLCRWFLLIPRLSTIRAQQPDLLGTGRGEVEGTT